MTKWLIKCSLTRLLLVNPEIVTDKFVQQLSFQVSSFKKKSHSGLFCFKAIENANKTEFSVFERCKGSSDWLRKKTIQVNKLTIYRSYLFLS